MLSARHLQCVVSKNITFYFKLKPRLMNRLILANISSASSHDPVCSGLNENVKHLILLSSIPVESILQNSWKYSSVVMINGFSNQVSVK